jgi:hypothetical protein
MRDKILESLHTKLSVNRSEISNWSRMLGVEIQDLTRWILAEYPDIDIIHDEKRI